jgi:hypothetical protein
MDGSPAPISCDVFRRPRIRGPRNDTTLIWAGSNNESFFEVSPTPDYSKDGSVSEDKARPLDVLTRRKGERAHELYLTMAEIFDLNKINVKQIADGRELFVLDELLGENARRHNYEVACIEGPNQIYAYTYVVVFDAGGMGESDSGTSKTLRGATALSHLSITGSAMISLGFPERHKMEKHCDLLRSLARSLDKEFIEIKELLCDLEMRAEFERGLDSKVKDLAEHLQRLGARIDLARDLMKKSVRIFQDVDAAKWSLRAAELIREAAALSENHVELIRKFVALLQ